MFSLDFTNRAIKFLKKSNTPAADLESIRNKIQEIKKNPYLHGSEKLKVSIGNYFRVRVGVYRIIYGIRNKELIIVIIYIGHRKEVYKNL